MYLYLYILDGLFHWLDNDSSTKTINQMTMHIRQ